LNKAVRAFLERIDKDTHEEQGMAISDDQIDRFNLIFALDNTQNVFSLIAAF
jgi:hypothetical protein